MVDKQSPARETLAIDVCRQLDEFQRVYQERTYDTAPGNAHYAGKLMVIVEAALAALRAAPAPTVDVQAIAEIAWRCIRECKCYYGPPVMCPGHQQEAQALVGAVAEPIDPHVTGRAKCRMCNHVCQSVAPVGTDLDNLECPNCHRMTLEVAP
jgi:hypothetical protein